MVDPDRPPIPYIYFPPVHGIELTSDDIEHGAADPRDPPRRQHGDER